MKKTLFKLLIFLSPSLAFAQTMDSSTIFRLNGIYVDEIIEDGDEGVGLSAEIAFIIQATEDFYQTIGFEVGYLASEAEEFDVEVDTDLIPFFANYTVGSYLGDTGLIIEAGAGVGVVFVDFDVSIDGLGSASDDDSVLGGQLFSRLVYKFTEEMRASIGFRYMIADDADFLGEEISDTLNSVAFDAGLSFAF
jgi:hypothetical protein